MRIQRGTAAAVTVLLLLAAGCNRAADGTPDRGPGPGSAWRVRPHAFPAAFEWQSGPRILLTEPNGGCYLALGEDSDGHGMRSGYWRASGDCTRPTRVGPSARPLADGLPSQDTNSITDAVRLPDGDALLIARHTFHNDAYAYETEIRRGNPTDGWHTVAQFQTDSPRESHIGPRALVAVDGRFVAIGQKESAAMVWISTDGIRWREVAVPDVTASFAAIASGPDGRLVILGTAGAGAASSWVSTDQGASWRAYPIAERGTARLSTLVHAGSRFVALGTDDRGDLRGPAAMYTSPDGVTWTRDTSAAQAGVHAIVKALALPDGSLLAPADAGATNGAAKGGDNECAKVWRYHDGRWDAEDVGCYGIPDALAVLPDGRIAAAHWTTLYLHPPFGR